MCSSGRTYVTLGSHNRRGIKLLIKNSRTVIIFGELEALRPDGSTRSCRIFRRSRLGLLKTAASQFSSFRRGKLPSRAYSMKTLATAAILLALVASGSAFSCEKRCCKPSLLPPRPSDSCSVKSFSLSAWNLEMKWTYYVSLARNLYIMHDLYRSGNTIALNSTVCSAWLHLRFRPVM